MSVKSEVETKIARLRYAGDEAFVGESPSGHAIVTSFSHEHVTAPTPMELLLISLGGCTGSDVVGILEKKRQRVTGYEIEVVHRLRGKALDAKAVAHAIELSESKYCSVSAMLGAAATIRMRYEIEEGDEPPRAKSEAVK